MAQRATQWLSRQVATGSGAPAGQLGARQRTAAHFCDQAAVSSSTCFLVSTRAQASAAQQPLASFTGSGAYVVVAQSASLAQSVPFGIGFGVGVGVSVGVGVGFAVGVGVGFAVGVGCSEWDEQARASTRRAARRMERLCP